MVFKVQTHWPTHELGTDTKLGSRTGRAGGEAPPLASETFRGTRVPGAAQVSCPNCQAIPNSFGMVTNLLAKGSWSLLQGVAAAYEIMLPREGALVI